MLGTFIGDALGGPIEFQGHAEIQASPNPPKLWIDTNRLMNDDGIKAAKDRMYLREYKYLLPFVQPYGCWTENAPPGAVTDDSRHKMILIKMLRTGLQKNQWPLTAKHSAQSYLDWSKSKTIKTHPGYDTLCPQWLGESYKSINWIMGSRKLVKPTLWKECGMPAHLLWTDGANANGRPLSRGTGKSILSRL